LFTINLWKAVRKLESVKLSLLTIEHRCSIYCPGEFNAVRAGNRDEDGGRLEDGVVAPASQRGGALMNTALWIAQSLLAAIMIAAGTPKLLLPRARLVEKLRWTKDAPEPLVRLLGLAELLGAVGLILPRLTGIAPLLTPIAAACLFLILIGALATKLRSHESPALPAVAMLLAASVVIGRVLG
jgi:uncharacterized membrane protein YphA (DoxX/SURF4 family)